MSGRTPGILRKPRAAPIVSVVTEDGELLTVTEKRRPSRSYGMSFHTVFDRASAEIAKTVSNGATLKVFIVLPTVLSFTVFRKLDQRKLGEAIGLNHSAVSRALKQLHELGTVEKRGAGAHIEWKLSPDFGWRGDVDSFHVEQRKRSASKTKPSPTGELHKSQKIYYGKRHAAGHKGIPR